MTTEELKNIGLTPGDVLEKLTQKLYDHYMLDREGDQSEFDARLQDSIKGMIDVVIAKTMTEHVHPRVVQMVEQIKFTKTNEWGERVNPTIPSLTFTEYLVDCADSYIREKVDYNGKTKTEAAGYNWSGKTTRISHMIHEHLQYEIARAMEKSLGEVNSSVRNGLEEAVKMALAGIKVSVDTKVSRP